MVQLHQRPVSHLTLEKGMTLVLHDAGVSAEGDWLPEARLDQWNQSSALPQVMEEEPKAQGCSSYDPETLDCSNAVKHTSQRGSERSAAIEEC